MRRIYAIVTAVLLAVILCTAAQGSEGEYIIKIRQDVMLLGETELEHARTVYAPEGVFCTSDRSLIKELEAAGVLEYCAPNETVYLQELPEQAEDLQTASWPRAMVGYSYGKNLGIAGKGVRVGIIDSGLSDPNKEFGSAVLEPGINFLVSEDHADRQNTADTYGHGTNVSRIIASEEVGLAPEATIIPLRCFDAKNGTAEHVVAAVYAAVDLYGCDVINLSLGTLSKNDALTDAVNHALEQDVIVVAAAGNLYSYEEGKKLNAYRYPAAQEGVLGVGAVDPTKTVHLRSARNDSVFVTAPGAEIEVIQPDTGAGYLSSGTSYAVPMVSAAAALARSQDPDLTGTEFADLLAQTAQDCGTPGYDVNYGHGVINVGLLLAALQEDSQDCVLSCDEAGLYLSAWRPAPASETYTVCVATYAENGQFCTASLMEACAGDLLLNNVPVSPQAAQYKILLLQEQTCAPLTPSIPGS